MKGKRNLLIGVILGSVMGWALGFLRLPYLEKNYSFLLGFILCLALVLFLVSLLFVWNKNALLIRLIGKKPVTKDTKTEISTHTIIWIMVTVFIVLGGLVSSMLIYRQNQMLEAQTSYQNTKILEMTELIESVTQNNQVFLMSNILDNVEDELKRNQNGTLSDAIVARIAALNYSFKPYRYFDGDSLSNRKYSPQKGQLLLALILMKMDSNCFAKIKRSTSFAGTDLSGANLKGADLSGIDLEGANLKYTDLSGANLKGTNLYKANLWGCNLNRAILDSADMKRVDLRWADLNKASLRMANLNGANLTNAILIKTDLRGTTFRMADFSGAMLNDADMTDCDLWLANLGKANLTSSNLTGCLLRGTKFSESILIGSEFTNASIQKDWFEQLAQWKTIGTKTITEHYRIVLDTSGTETYLKYCLEKIET